MVQKKTLCRKTVGLESKLYQGVNYNYDLEESCDPLKKSVIFRRNKQKNIKKSKGLLRLSLSQTAFTPTLK